MADGNNIRCFGSDPNCPCGCQKAGAQEMSSSLRKRRARLGKPAASVTKAKEKAVQAAVEQSSDSGGQP